MFNIIITKNGEVLSDEEIKKLIIEKDDYYKIVNPIRKKINEMFSTNNKIK